MNVLSKIIQDIEKFFSSGKAKAALEQTAALAVQAAPIVAAIETLVPTNNRTVQAVEAAYAKYAVPVSTQIVNDPTSINNALMNLATTLLAKKLPAAQANAATSVLNTAVQLAVVGVKASA